MIIAKRIIIKIQVPLAGDPILLCHSEGRKYTCRLPYTKQLKKDLKYIMRGDDKAYAHADVVEKGSECIFDIFERAPEQDW